MHVGDTMAVAGAGLIADSAVGMPSPAEGAQDDQLVTAAKGVDFWTAGTPGLGFPVGIGVMTTGPPSSPRCCPAWGDFFLPAIDNRCSSHRTIAELNGRRRA